MDGEKPTAQPSEGRPLDDDEADPYQRGVQHGRRLGAYSALASARRTLRQAGPIELARALDRLVAVEDLGEVLRQLERAADRAVQGGEQS